MGRVEGRRGGGQRAKEVEQDAKQVRGNLPGQAGQRSCVFTLIFLSSASLPLLS